MDAETVYLCPSLTTPPDLNIPIALEGQSPTSTSDVHHITLGSANNRTQPTIHSTFKAVMEGHKAESMIVIDDPFSATVVARNAMLGAWEDRASREDRDAKTILDADWEESSKRSGNDVKQRREALLNQTRKTASEPVDAHEGPATTFRAAIQDFRYDDTEYLLKEENHALRHAMIDEARQWKFLHDKLERVEVTLADHIAMYAQRAAIEDAFATKMQALETSRQTQVVNE
ncbi:hypothetical protein NM208_g5978 [Fusarium decemcellulare]|uniref:Uncharacterized protein n=1 Tax=Fusarium decemcellulare TaxID=57161 RepID=A0ACC1SF42_9HYPO|nr:hypothetical protein NM208_g5978 [Fusarium decemcellulare]